MPKTWENFECTFNTANDSNTLPDSKYFISRTRMQRAAFRQQAGNLAGALDDVRAALQSIPPDWPRRNDAIQFERSLASQVGK